MAYTITKTADGDDGWARRRLEHVILQPAPSDYLFGGYLIQGVSGSTEKTGNVGLGKVEYVWPCGGQGGYNPVFNPTTSKLQVFTGASGAGPDTEVANGTDLSAYGFRLLIAGTS